MEDVLRLMFGFGPKRQRLPEPKLQMQNEEGTERVMLYPDTSGKAVAARHSMSQIYGAQNVPANFGMRPVIEVRDPSGAWVPVSGSKDAVPDGTTQIAYLQNFRETGQVGVTPLAPDAIVGQAGEIGGGAAGTQMTASAEQNAQPPQPQQLLSFGGMPVMPMSALQMFGQQPQAVPGQESTGGPARQQRQTISQSSEGGPARQPRGTTPGIENTQGPGVQSKAGAHPSALSQQDVNNAAAMSLPGARANGMGGGSGMMGAQPFILPGGMLLL